MKPALALLALACALFAAPLVKRDLLKSLEKDLTGNLRSHEMEFLAYPSGYYVDGVGVVFTAELLLTYAPMVTPFQQVFPPEYKVKIHDKEMKQLPVLRDEMRQLLLKSSVTLDTLPSAEKIVVAVKIDHQTWEDTTGIPEQIVMQGIKSQLMAAKLGHGSIESSILVREQ